MEHTSQQAIHKVAPNVKPLPVKFLSGSKGDSEDAVEAIKYAISRGARIINCSWNFIEYNIDMYQIMKSNPNVLFVCPAGNVSVDFSKASLYPPKFALDNIITVMAIDNRGNICESSGFGETVDIAAPGVDINVTFPDGEDDPISGTSISVAFVSAATQNLIALFRRWQKDSAFIRGFGSNQLCKQPSLWLE